MKRPFLPTCLLLCALLPLAVRAALPDAARFSVALEVGDVAQAKAWLDEGLNPNFEGSLIGTGLMIGARDGNLALMELFLARGADINRSNRFGETALMLAAWKNQRPAMRWLLEHGAQVNPGEHAWSALHYAAFAGHSDMLDDLLMAGADVNARSTNGSTVVMMAAREGHAAIARRLQAAGANPALKNDAGEDAVAWAMRQGNYDIAKSFTSAANFAALSRAATNGKPPVRSQQISNRVDDHLRIAHLAEARGMRNEALAAYRKALATLQAEQAPAKVGTSKDAKAPPPPELLVIRARRSEPGHQSLSVSYGSQEEATVDALLEQARAAAAAGWRQEALQLYRQASVRIKAVQ